MSQSEPLRPSRKPHQAGEVESLPTGRLTYLAPKPLPTGALPVDFGRAVGFVTDHYLDFGVGNSFAFAWQMVLGGPFVLFLLGAVLVPLMVLLVGLHSDTIWADVVQFTWGVFNLSFWIGLGGGCSVYFWQCDHAGKCTKTPKK